MRIPVYWSRATAEQVDSEGKKAQFSCWRWSDASEADARESALAAATRILQSFLRGQERGRYDYGDGALREDVKQRFTNDRGELIAVITQNSYGSLVLSTARVMFVDVNFPPVLPGENMRHFFGRWFNKTVLAPEAQRERQARDRLGNFLSDHAEWGGRVYRTRAGLRVIATHALFDPAADATRQTFESLGTDPLYVRLCKAQNSFRARLTPKPWRCGHASNTIGWPRESEEQQKAFDRWQQAYLDRQSNFATCRFLGAVGSDAVDPEAATIIDIHDRATRSHESLALA